MHAMDGGGRGYTLLFGLHAAKKQRRNSVLKSFCFCGAEQTLALLQTSASALTYKKVTKHIFLEEFMHLIANFSFFCKLLIKT